MFNPSKHIAIDDMLLLLEPPVFKRELEMVEVVKGQMARLQCEVTGTAPFDITWLKDKRPVMVDKKHTIVSKDAISFLEIQTFDSVDVGDYQCSFSNDVGKISTKSIVKLKGLYHTY